MSGSRERRRIPNRILPSLTALARVAPMLVALVACAPARQSPPEIGGRRLELLDEAYAIRAADPLGAAQLLADAGPGPVLERVRLEAWIEALARANGDERSWRRLLDSSLPAELAARARRGLARRLLSEDRLDEAVADLEGVSERDRVWADTELVGIEDGPWRIAAAERLAVSAPEQLRRSAPELERTAVAALDFEERLERSRAWRAAGQPGRAAAELRRERWRGEQERLRGLELGRAEIDAGSPTRAVAAVRRAPSTDLEAELIRGQAYRRQGWQRWPRSTARSSFTACLHHARRVAHADDVAATARVAALELVVECGTEVGRLDEAVEAWWEVEALGWIGARRQWLGRRLGVALGTAGDRRHAVERLAGSLPDHARCLRYWAAFGSAETPADLSELLAPVFADIYGLWLREIWDISAPEPSALEAPIEPAAAPWSVRWLLERDAVAEAAEEWRRVRTARGTTPAEGMAEVALAERRGRRNEAIVILRDAMPELGTVAMERAPGNAIRSYLPLPWVDAIRDAARESGVQPWLVAAVARQESAFVPHARSPRGALGVMQLLPGTARKHSLALGLGARPALEQPEVNLRIGSRELGRLLDTFGSVEPALAAYNAGESRVKRWWREQPNRSRFTEAIPIPETYNYVRRVRFLAEAYRVTYDSEWRLSQ